MTEKKAKSTTIVFKSSDDGKSIILEEKRLPGFVYQYVAIPRFKEDGKIKIVFETKMSGKLWPIYAIGMIIYYSLRAIPFLAKMVICKIFGHSPIKEITTVRDKDDKVLWRCERIVCKRCYEEIKFIGIERYQQT